MSEKNNNDDILFGKHVVLSTLRDKQPVNKLYLQKGLSKSQFSDILALVKQQSIIVNEVPKTKLDELTDGGNHQGVVLTIPPIAYATLDDIYDLAESKDEAPFILILDEIEDPHNLGSIIRTADATGVHGIIIPKRRAVGLTGVVAKTSAGAINNVPVVRVTNLSQTISQLKERGIWIFATAMEGEDMRSWNSAGPIALVIGNEGEGVSANILKIADGTVTIPMTGQVQSLNASVAAAVLMYEVARDRIQ